jgi:hypothetical protein
VSRENTSVICDYVTAMKTEINLSDNCRTVSVRLLIQFSIFHNQKSFNLISKEDILAFLDGLRKTIGSRQYAEIIVNGKTGTRTLPLIVSIPYLKEYLSNGHHPNAPLICGEYKSLGRSITPGGLYHLYTKYRTQVYPKLLESPNVQPEDKRKIRELLKKPWNPYVVGRHRSVFGSSF